MANPSTAIDEPKREAILANLDATMENPSTTFKLTPWKPNFSTLFYESNTIATDLDEVAAIIPPLLATATAFFCTVDGLLAHVQL
nr:hypothetical protein CFP56_74147 [Quercus suber]